MNDAQPLELILARNLISIISIAALLVDLGRAASLFFNEAERQRSSAHRSRRSACSVRMSGAPATEPFGRRRQTASAGRTCPLTTSGPRVAARLRALLRAGGVGMLEIETGALPLSGPAGYHGAIVVFWPLPARDGS